jgi:hypothetical protein
MKGCGWASAVRGLYIKAPTVIQTLTTYRERLYEKLQGRVYVMLEQWRSKLVQADEISGACIVHTHMAYIFRFAHCACSASDKTGNNTPNAPMDPDALSARLTWKAIETLLSCQIYLTHNYGFSMEAPGAMSKQNDPNTDNNNNNKDKDAAKSVVVKKRGKGGSLTADHSLGFSQMEIFDMFQSHRKGMLRWIEISDSRSCSDGSQKLVDGKDAGQLLETVIRVLTSKERLGKPLGNVHAGCARRWTSLPSPGCLGRLCPDTEIDAYKQVVDAALRGVGRGFEEWLRITTTAAVETEINVQVGTFTLKSNQTEMLGEPFTTVFMRDIEDVMCSHAHKRMQCARVAETQARLWVRLVGIRHDLQLWAPDTRQIAIDTSSVFGQKYSVLSTSIPAWFHAGET